MKFQNIDELIEKRSYTAYLNQGGPSGLDSRANYWGDEPDVVLVVSRSRDASILTESNFATALEMLGGEGNGVSVVNVGHWACGWVEHIVVDFDAKDKLEIALKIINSIYAYPVLDDFDFSDREYQYASEYAEDTKEDLNIAFKELFNLPDDIDLTDLMYEAQMLYQLENGVEDAALGFNLYHGIPERDIDNFMYALESMKHNYMDKNLKLQYEFVTALLGGNNED